MPPLLALLRPRHWIKNFLIAAPLVFAGRFLSVNLENLIIAFLAFSAVASTIYVVNDLADAPQDRKHPEKKYRPIAAGTVSPKLAWVAIVTLLVVASFLALQLPVAFQITLLAYGVMNAAYSHSLKHKLIIDVMILSFGFVMRVLAGGFAVGIVLSNWIILCTFFGALFIGFGKRKNETDILQDGSKQHRKVLENYTTSFINQLLGTTAAMTIMSYALYTIDPATAKHFGTTNLVYTLPFVVYGVFRYFHLMYNQTAGADPTKIFSRDHAIQLCFLAWIITFYTVIKLA
ncbi:decaprenyl-phosphate phosphoribosyltransferase [soil metagenome]